MFLTINKSTSRTPILDKISHPTQYLFLALSTLCTGLSLNLVFLASRLLLELSGRGPLGFRAPLAGLLNAVTGLLSKAGLPALAALTSSTYVLGLIGTLGGR